ncbi:MAG: alpha/beta hydrolase [Actinomycetota bacterium]|nr:alpha/beta hydrolase [Actinomycetota bacterium]
MDTVVASGAVALAVREFGGTGSPMLLLHGAGSTLADMAPLATHLTADHRVVGMDLRNHGQSGDGPWSWDAVLGDVRAVIEQLELTSPILVGHSLGGMLAVMYSHCRGGIAGAVNLDGFGTGAPDQYDMDPAEVVRLLQRLHSLTDEKVDSLTQPQTSEQVSTSRRAWVSAASALGLETSQAEEAFDRPLVAGPRGTLVRRPVAERLAQLRTCIDELDVLGLYRQTAAPHLVYVAVRAQPDPSLPPELNALALARQRAVAGQVRAIALARPNIQVIELDATHGLVYEQPNIIAGQICAFASRLACLAGARSMTRLPPGPGMADEERT